MTPQRSTVAAGAMNFLGEAMLHQFWNHAGVINMGMGEQHRIKARRIKREFAVVQFALGFVNPGTCRNQ